MRIIIKRVVAFVTLLSVCIGLVSGYAEVIKAAGSNRPYYTTSDGSVTTRYTVLLLDVEGGFSMLNNGVEIYKVETPIESVKQAAIKFVEQMSEGEGENHVAVIAYGAESKLICDFTDDINTLKGKITNINSINGFADINEGLLYSQEILNKVVGANVTKNIVHFTQGVNGIGDEYLQVGKYSSEDCNWYNTATNIKFYEYSNATYKTFESMKDSYNIYSIGLFQQFDEVPELGKPVLDFAKKFSEDIQNAGYIEVDDVDNLIFAFDKVAEDITIEPISFCFASVYAKRDIQATCYYSDSYFYDKASVYNDHLATMSLCLELSTWSSLDKNAIWTDSENAIFPKFQNARNLLVYQLGFEDFKVNEFWGEKPTAHSIGAVIANKKLSDGSTLVALAIRGGGYGQEWASNFNVGLEGEHAGFTEAKDNVVTFLDRYLRECCITGKVKLWIVGYSRGGAVANLVAAELSKPTYYNGYYWDRNDVYAYTFEAPQGTIEDEKKAMSLDNIHNIINVNDLVPNVAPLAWDFKRYGKDKILPNSINVGDPYSEAYNIAVYKMEKYLEQFKMKGEEVPFNTKEIFVYKAVEINPSKILPGGEPVMYYYGKFAYKYNTIKDFVDLLAEDLIGGREEYYYKYQSLISDIMVLVNNGTFDDIFEDEVLELEFWPMLSKKMTEDRITEIISPLWELRLMSVHKRIEEVVENFKGLIMETLDEIGGGYSILAITEAFDSIDDIIYNFGELFIDAIGEDDYSKINTIRAIILLIKEKILMQPHYPEFTLAWMMYNDSYYGENDRINVGRSYRVIHINCPVNVNVYSEDTGMLVASIINNEPVEVEGSYINAFVNMDGEKIVLLPADTNYRIDITAYGNGNFSYTIDEYSYDVQGNVRTINYYDIMIEEDDTFVAYIPKMSDEELYVENLLGSSVNYSLINGENVELVPNNEVRGENATEVFEVKTVCGNDYGYTLGGGSYSVGSYAQVEAYPMYGGEFLGWFNGEELVSTEEIYRFPVKKNTDLIAMFSKIELYNVTFAQEEGGTVINSSITAPEGVMLQVKAEMLDGYEFEGWVSDSNGCFEDPYALDTTYQMTNEDTHITAMFRRVGADEFIEKIIDDVSMENEEGINRIEAEIVDVTMEEVENIKKNEDIIVDLNTGTKWELTIVAVLLMFSSIILFRNIKKYNRGA